MREVVIQGAAMTRFGRHADRSARDLVEEVVAGALADAGVEVPHVQAAYVGNASAGLMGGQESVRGQVVLRHTGLLGGVPVVNVENADVSSSTALHLAWQAVAGGVHDRVLVLGYEKVDHADRRRIAHAYNATMDLAEVAELFGPSGLSDRVHGLELQGFTEFDPELLALVAVKNRIGGSRNPCAFLRQEVTVEQVLAAPPVAGPLTRLMCAPSADGAACLVLCAPGSRAGRTGTVRVAASVLASGRGDDMSLPYSAAAAAARAYTAAAAGPEDLDVVELCDSTAHAELHLYRQLGLCPEGGEERLVRDREVWPGGRLPVNPSGGLISRGHPMGATGLAQVVELCWQLEGRCGARQVPSARLALAHTVAGWVGSDVAACSAHVLQT